MTDNPQQSRDLASKDQLLEEFVAAAVAELRGHRYCGDAYPQNGWPGVNAALAKYEAWRRAVETKAAPRDFMRLSTPWPLPDVLEKLLEATEHLLKDHDCDAHGHELFRRAVKVGRDILPLMRGAVETSARPRCVCGYMEFQFPGDMRIETATSVHHRDKPCHQREDLTPLMPTVKAGERTP